MKKQPWRQIIWVISSLISMFGLVIIGWLVWSLRKGPPRDPGSQIALGFVVYAALIIRAIGLGGMIMCFRTKHPHLDLALVAHVLFLALFYVLLMWMLSSVGVFFLVIGCVLVTGALGVDLFLLSSVRHIKR